MPKSATPGPIAVGGTGAEFRVIPGNWTGIRTNRPGVSLLHRAREWFGFSPPRGLDF